MSKTNFIGDEVLSIFTIAINLFCALIYTNISSPLTQKIIAIAYACLFTIFIGLILSIWETLEEELDKMRIKSWV